MSDRDYKHVYQDMTNLYIGGKLSYAEILDIDEVPFKFKCILSHYITKEVASDTTIENHIFYMKPEDMSYMIYKKMKVKFRLYIFDHDKQSYVSKDLRIDEIVGDSYLYANKNTIFVEEMHVYKINMLSVS